MTPVRRVDAAVVGGGPAGAAIATRLARLGREVVVLERSQAYRWRACGVFSSPASMDELRDLGLAADVLCAVARPIPAMRVESAGGTEFRLTYGDDGSGRVTAVGFDRASLDTAMLALAEAAGAEVLRGTSVERLDLPAGGARPRLVVRDGRGEAAVEAAVVAGADGIRSLVARTAGVARPARLGARVGLTYHLSQPPRAIEAPPEDAWMVLFPGGYCGIAPVPGERVNIGIVLDARRWRRDLRGSGATAVASRIVAGLRSREGGERWTPFGRRIDRVAGAAPLGHRVTRQAGDGWLLVGDAAGFLDPFTGEGIHRALVSARLGASAIDAHLAGHREALARYEAAMRDRFGPKDALSRLVQLFLGRPRLFDYAARRLADRDRVRETMSLVMADLVPAGRALDPRFVAALLAP